MPSTPVYKPLQRMLLLAFALPTVMQGFMHGPEGQIQAIYAKHAGLSLSALAAAVLLTRMFDAITFPLIGYLSDRSFAKTGSRKPWVIAGTLISIVGMWFLYRPPAQVTVVYYGVWTAVTYIGWKVSEIPYTAWSYGLSRDYAERARVQIWRAMALMIGGMLFYSTPYLSAALKLSTTTELNLEALGLTAVICAIVTPLVNLYALRRVPNGEADAPVADARPSQFGFKQTLSSILRNGPMLRLIAAFGPVSVLSGMSTGVQYLFIDTYLGLAKEYAAIMLAAAPVTILGIPFWGWLCMRHERHRVWAVSLASGAVFYAMLAFVPAGAKGLPAVMVLYPLCMLCLVGMVVAVPSLIGDVADYGRYQTGEDFSGLYASVFAFLQKSLIGVSAAAGIAIVSGFDFDPAALQQSARGEWGIKLVAVWLPALGFAIAAIVAWSFPLSRAELAKIRLALRSSETPT